MGLEKYYQFITNPNIKTFNELINNISEFKKVYKLNNKKLENLVEKLKEKHLNSEGELKIKSNRKGPLFSATCFPLDLKLPTEKQLWITSKSGGKQVWKLLADYNFKQTYNKKRGLETFQFNKKTLELDFELKKVENKLNTFGGKLAIGELSMHYEKIKSDYYSIWGVGGTLIAVPYGTTKDSILKATWKFIGYGIPVDGGTFGFHNGTMFDYIRSGLTTKTKSKNKNIKYFGEYVNSVYDYLIGHNKNGANISGYGNGTEINGDDLIKFKNTKLTKWVTTNKMEKEVMGFYFPNSYGDGYFDVYKSGDMYLILSPDIHWLMHRLHLDYF